MALAALAGVLIQPRAWTFGCEAILILFQGTSKGFDDGSLRRDPSAIDGLANVHNLHAWRLTPDMDAVNAHLTTREGTDPHPVIGTARRELAGVHEIADATPRIGVDSPGGRAVLCW